MFWYVEKVRDEFVNKIQTNDMVEIVVIRSSVFCLHIADLDINFIWISSKANIRTDSNKFSYPVILISDKSVEHLHHTFAGPICQEDKFRVPAITKHIKVVLYLYRKIK